MHFWHQMAVLLVPMTVASFVQADEVAIICQVDGRSVATPLTIDANTHVSNILTQPCFKYIIRQPEKYRMYLIQSVNADQTAFPLDLAAIRLGKCQDFLVRNGDLIVVEMREKASSKLAIIYDPLQRLLEIIRK